VQVGMKFPATEFATLFSETSLCLNEHPASKYEVSLVAPIFVFTNLSVLEQYLELKLYNSLGAFS
jgi:hypothetical protein